MRKLLLCIGLLALMAGRAPAISSGVGGIVYWSDTVSGAFDQYRLYSLTFDETYTITQVKASFDNVAEDNTYTWQDPYRRHGLEIFDPRQGGGQGRVIQNTIYNNNLPNSGNGYDEPWDLVMVNPAAPLDNDVVLFDGIYYTYNQVYDQQMLQFVVAPENWVSGTTSNGLSFIHINNAGRVSYRFDADANGVIDNTTAENRYLGNMGRETRDLEMGADNALYRSSYAYGGGLNTYNMDRTWVDASGVRHTDKYAQIGGGTAIISGQTDGLGIAAGKLIDNSPILYLLAIDNDIAQATARTNAIFALKDLNGDNDAMDDGEVVKIWRRGDFGLSSMRSGEYGGEDLEFYMNPDNGAMFLFASDYDGKMWVLELADNGLAAVSGKMMQNTVNAGPNGYKAGFEIDFNVVQIGPPQIPGDANNDGKVDSTDLGIWQQNYDPIGSSGAGGGANVPEPATLLLVGSGLLGGLGVLRRRRTK